MTRGVKSGRVCSGGKDMRDRMQDDVCACCGSDELEMRDGPSWGGWDEWYCHECNGIVEVESRAEYLAANDDDPRDDHAVERAVGAEVGDE